MDSLRGTYLIDQADLLKRKGNEELVDILTDSYKKEGGKRRIMIPTKKGWKTTEKETYAPKAFASIGELPEDLADRCLIIPLIKSQKNFPQPSSENENWKEIRGKFYKVLFTNFSVIKSNYEVLNVQYRRNSKIIGRELELWLPLEAILKFCIDSEEKLAQIWQRFRQNYTYSEYEPSDLEKAVIEAVDSFLKENEKEEIELKPSDIRERIEENVWINKFLTGHQKDIRIGYIIKKFNLSTEKRKRSYGITYLFQREKVEKIKNLYTQAEKNTSNSSLLLETNKNELKNGLKTKEELEKITLQSEELRLHKERD